MSRRPAASVLAALGVPAELERLHQRILPLSGSTLGVLASRLVTTPEDLEGELSRLVDFGLVELVDDRVRVLSPSGLVATMVATEAELAARSRERLEDLALAIPHLVAAASRPAPGEVAEVADLDGEVTSGGNPLKLLRALVENSRGDLLWFRPDAWRIPRESAVAEVIAAAVRSGRRSRAIYPELAVREAPEALQVRADAGEEIRVVPELPTRLIVIGTTHAVLPEPLGHADEPRLLIRQPAIVGALSMLFESTWSHATPVPGFEARRSQAHARHLLLRQLAAGAKDEQIARTMGLSLRTVRRRVAELLDEFHVETRFQAGVEAARRGLL
ncbi:Helix-turn-helix, type 11 domain protein [metagenome]|uniref:Helix-turn-helix, type 11 domain protein n=1 Tax=metagenome TaxID=256318 RepID=A0A2P2BZT9_9ZZZZ